MPKDEQQRLQEMKPGPRPAGGNAPPSPPWRTEGLPEQPPPKRSRRWTLLALGLLGYLIFFGLVTFQDRMKGPVHIPYTEFKAQVANGNVRDIFARGNSIQGELRNAAPVPVNPGGEPVEQNNQKQTRTYEKFTTERPTFADDDLLGELTAHQAVVRATPITDQRGLFTNLLISLAPFLLLILFYAWMLKRQKSMGKGLFGASRMTKPVNPDSVRATFNDVAGIDEVREQIGDIVDFLRHPDKYRRVGAHAPKGVLLAGPPGTGKTLLARATAGEAGVPFFSASASEFIEMIVGVGASRARDLFNEARKVAPSIIFIDEMDAIGRMRAGSRSFGGSDEREQTLNQILTEMDGFSGDEGVVVIAATNRPDVLDPALLRPGRFDRQIMVHPPDRKGRAAILRVHTRRVPLAPDVDIDDMASSTPGMTGADLANLVNEAALLAAQRFDSKVTQRDFAEALEKVQLGAARNLVMPEEDRRRTAYHEAGHALLGMLQPGADPVRKVSIIPRGRSLGATLSTPDEDRYGYDESYLRGKIIGALGGMAAEKEVFNVVTTGAESDLEGATRVARSMVGRWGMSDTVGKVSVLPLDGDPRMEGTSDAMLNAVDKEVKRITDECYDEAQGLLRANRDKLDRIVTELLIQETLNEAEIYAAAGIPRPASDKLSGQKVA